MAFIRSLDLEIDLLGANLLYTILLCQHWMMMTFHGTIASLQSYQKMIIKKTSTMTSTCILIKQRTRVVSMMKVTMVVEDTMMEVTMVVEDIMTEVTMVVEDFMMEVTVVVEKMAAVGLTLE